MIYIQKIENNKHTKKPRDYPKPWPMPFIIREIEETYRRRNCSGASRPWIRDGSMVVIDEVKISKRNLAP